ncbi:aldehyde dehydrogenase family protein [Rhodococcus pseudokoreensis]|uniref:Aldehyde dehydrogenase family protein n=2 Tax=Rhodococcus pseudokoreensis TaxID=2811421 RepID=A0A974WD57_9NOCA|nr:aldehyde dehydrogenase family protein [Rhodococcus pseudokoreensis]
MTIDGHSVKADRTFEVVNPATARRVADAPECAPSQVDDVMEAAVRAFASWKVDDDARRRALRAGADELDAAAHELAVTLTAEHGKPLRDSLREVATAATWFRWYADLDLGEPEIVEDSAARRIAVYRRPLGPAVAITPWNYPIQMAGKKAAQALRPGNTVVVKPSPYTPLATLKFVEILQRVFPPGVLSAVTGSSNDLGRWLTEHPLTRKVSFTGSTGVGKLVAASAVPDLKRVTLELGGNDAAIVLDDAAPELIAKEIFARAFVNCGQTCAAIKRLYVPEQLHELVVDALAEYARAAVVGNGMESDTELGPLNNHPQQQLVSELVDDALRNGARAAAGGRRPDTEGYFYRPTILTDVDDGMRIVNEEQFGPALPVLSYRHLDDAIERANNSNYGLGGSVWTSDPDRGAEIARRLDCGTAWVNTHAITLPHQPFAGAKWSGMGVENGRWGLHDFTQLQAIHTAR